MTVFYFYKSQFMNLKLPLTLALLIASPLTWATSNHTGTILETMNSGGYTYARIKENQKEFWIAGNTTAVKVGDVVSFSEQMSMPAFTSKTLSRTFKDIMFVGSINQGNTVASSSPAGLHGKIAAPIASVSNITKAVDGYTVAELFSRKAELKGKVVKVRGKVVKVSNEIMKTNWIHIQDGTGTAGTRDIIFRAKTATANVGDVVLASGTLVTDQDFGYGYKYEVIVEDASFEVNK